MGTALLDAIAGPLSPAALSALWLVWARLLPLCLLAPFVLPREAPSWLGLSVAAVLTLGVAPVALATAEPVALSAAELVWATLRELGIGLAFAFVLSAPFWALGWAGELWWRFGGLGTDAAGTVGAPPLSELLRLCGVLVFFAVAGPALLLDGICSGLSALPPGATPSVFAQRDLLLGAARAVADALVLSVSVALPLVCAIWLLEALLGVLQRGFGALAVASFAVPLRALLVLGVALTSSALLLSSLPAVFREALRVASRLWS